MNDINTSTQFKTEGQPAFPVATPESENSAASSTETTSTDSTPSSEGDTKTGVDKKTDGDGEGKNFADHPRWREREQDWTKRFNEQETRHTQELEKIRKDLEAKFTPKETPKDSIDTEQAPSWFGGDENQWKEFKKWNDGLMSQAETRGAEKAMRGIEEKTQAEQKAIEQATEFFNQEVTMLETDKTINPNGDKVDRNKLLKFVLDNDLVDSKGRWNYKAGYLMMKNANPAKSADTKEKKQIAGASLDDKKAEDKATNFTTSNDFNKPGARPW